MVNLLKTEPDVQGFESNLERELSIVSGLFENLKHILGGDPTIFHKEILNALVTQYDQFHQNQIDLLRLRERVKNRETAHRTTTARKHVIPGAGGI